MKRSRQDSRNERPVRAAPYLLGPRSRRDAVHRIGNSSGGVTHAVYRPASALNHVQTDPRNSVWAGPEANRR
jgi:hypothetical protein